MELHRKYRPAFLKQVVGQDSAVATLKALIQKGNVPHALMFTGPSGCGKTTLARIVANKLGCGDRDFEELNCADSRGIEAVRNIRTRISLAPMSGECRVWLLDEAHKLTNDAQTLLLKPLEDTPKHVYFMLATTDPHKVISTIQTRCTEIKLSLLNTDDLKSLLMDVIVKEGMLHLVSEDVRDRLVDAAEGSARKLLVLLQQVIGLKDEDAQIAAIKRSQAKEPALELFKALINPYTKWPKIAAILRKMEEDPESVRYYILAAARNVLLSAGKSKEIAYSIIVAFSEPFYETKQAGLAASAYEVAGRRK